MIYICNDNAFLSVCLLSVCLHMSVSVVRKLPSISWFRVGYRVFFKVFS